MSTAQPKVTQDGERRGLITIAPGDDGTPHTATFIGPIHGLGDTNMGWAQQAMMLHQQLPWVKFVLPRATSSSTLNGGMAMPSWYDITDLTDRAGQECTGIDESRAEIIELIEEAKAEGSPASRIVVGGFSQGGAMALFTGLQYPEALAGVLCMSGYLAKSEGFELAAAAASTPVLHCHGVVDEVVRIGWARESVEKLKEMGVKDYTLKCITNVYGDGADRRSSTTVGARSGPGSARRVIYITSFALYTRSTDATRLRATRPPCTAAAQILEQQLTVPRWRR